MIFETIFTDQYKAINCGDNGACDCPPALLTLKEQFLAAGGCEDTDEYSCLSEDFYGESNRCFVPASLEYGESSIYCSMAAKVHQYEPCDTVLDIPELAYDAYCTAITGWYDRCDIPDNDDDDICSAANFYPLDDPLFIDLDTCYSNPTLGQRSITFFGKAADGKVKEYHIIFASDGPDDYRPFECDIDGACVCNEALLSLKEQFGLNSGCQDDPNGDYTCLSKDFFGVSDRCFVPASTEGDPDFSCSMVARLEKFDPCDKSELGFGVVEGTTTGGSDEVPTDQSADPDTSGADPDTNGADPDTSEADPDTSGADPDIRGADPDTIAPLANDATVAFNLAITGWWTDCTDPTTNDEGFCHSGNVVEPDSGPIYIDFNSCYSNPNFDRRSTSFYAVDIFKDELIAFHMMFTSDAAYAKYAPTDCDNGVCDCSLPSVLGDLRDQMLKKGSCRLNIEDGVNCVTQSSKGFAEACYVPMMEDVDTVDGKKISCAMVASIAALPRSKHTGDTELPGEAEEPKQPEGASTPNNEPAQTANVAGLVIGILFSIAALATVFFFIVRARKVEKAIAEKSVYDDGVNGVVWMRRKAHNPNFSTSIRRYDEHNHDLQFTIA